MKFRRAAIAATLVMTCLACGGVGAVESSEDQLADDSPSVALARFTPLLTSLRNAIELPATPEAAADKLLSSGRGLAFSLQSLCRVYKDADPKFAALRDDFKSIEDGVGGYDKWDGVYREAVSEGKDATTLAKLKKNRDDALADFTKILVDNQWRTDGKIPTRGLNAETFLKSYNFGSRTKDRDLVLESLTDELKNVQETTYDMHILEVGNGVHELRRDIRWELMEQLTLNGMITYKPDNAACPVPAYAGILTDPIAASKYVTLAPTAAEPNPCQVSKCLVYAAAKTVEDLGSIKDMAEKEVNINGEADVVPESLRVKAQAIYDGIVKNDLINAYRTELKACKSPKKDKSDAGPAPAVDAGPIQK